MLTLLVVVASLIDSTAHAQSPADVLIRHATIVDVEHARLIADQAVATSGDRILAVGPDGEIAQAWKAAKTLDAGKRFLIPGLWDMHVHFGGGVDLIEENKALLPLYVAHGITTIRDCSGDLRKHSLIVGPGGNRSSNWVFHRNGRRAAVRVEPRLATSSNEVAIAAAIASLGIAATATWGCRAELERGSLVSVLNGWNMGTAQMNALFPAGRAAKPAARAFVEYLAAALLS